MITSIELVDSFSESQHYDDRDIIILLCEFIDRNRLQLKLENLLDQIRDEEGPEKE